jgi:solute:Na+ symporter, SSS family
MTHQLYSRGTIDFPSALAADFWGAIVAFTADVVVTVVVSLVTKPRPVEDLDGLVWGMAAEEPEPTAAERVWWRRPRILAGIAIAMVVVLNIVFI